MVLRRLKPTIFGCSSAIARPPPGHHSTAEVSHLANTRQQLGQDPSKPPEHSDILSMSDPYPVGTQTRQPDPSSMRLYGRQLNMPALDARFLDMAPNVLWHTVHSTASPSGNSVQTMSSGNTFVEHLRPIVQTCQEGTAIPRLHRSLSRCIIV